MFPLFAVEKGVVSSTERTFATLCFGFLLPLLLVSVTITTIYNSSINSGRWTLFVDIVRDSTFLAGGVSGSRLVIARQQHLVLQGLVPGHLLELHECSPLGCETALVKLQPL